MNEQNKYKLLKYDIICIENMKMWPLLAVALYIQVKIICTIH